MPSEKFTFDRGADSLGPNVDDPKHHAKLTDK